jgi:hypothetical protein
MRGCPSSRLQLLGPRAGIRTSETNKTSGFWDFTKDNTSDLLYFRRFTNEFAFQQQIVRTLQQLAAAAGAFEGANASCSRSRF